MFIINIFFIFFFNFLKNYNYFILCFSVLAEKIKYYFFNISRFVFNFLWLGELVATYSKPEIKYLATKSYLIRELPQHCEMMRKALEMNQIYCPSEKGSKHDGCMFDPVNREVTSMIQLKLKDLGSKMDMDKLLSWVEEYKILDKLNIGFLSPEEYKLYTPLIEDINLFQIKKGLKLRLESEDYSLFLSKDTCKYDIKGFLDIQVRYNKIVEEVNHDWVNEMGEILDKFII